MTNYTATSRRRTLTLRRAGVENAPPMPSLRFVVLCPLLFVPVLRAAEAVPAPDPAAGSKQLTAEATNLLERFVSWLHHFFPGVDDALFHWIACGIVVVLAILLRRIITNIIFHYLKKLAEKTETTLDDKLFPALEGPAATLVLVLGIFAALTVLQLSEHADHLINNGATIAVLGVLLWGAIKAGGAILDHLEEVAHEKSMTVATFMPLIKKTLFVFAVIVGLLLIADSLGAKIGVFLTSLGIGGLAFALAAQDTIANFFGSFVVVIDQPFKVGDVVKIGAAEGKVEDIGLRSTKIRTGARTLIILPNKLVAGEPITNFTRMPQRRVDQTIGLNCDTTPEQMEAIVKDIHQLLRSDPEVHKETIVANFADFGTSSLDIQIVYFASEPNWQKHMELRERINLAIMRAVAARGLAFAFPTQTMHLDGPVAKALVERKG
jgi:MscS family membrane protein